MLKEAMQELDEELEYITHEYIGERIIIRVRSKRKEVICPYCGEKTNKVYSKYSRRFQDLPIQGKNVIVLIESRKLICENSVCEKKTFVERFGCISQRGRVTKRLEEKIMQVAKHTSSITASGILSEMGIKIGKSSICRWFKKK